MDLLVHPWPPPPAAARPCPEQALALPGPTLRGKLAVAERFDPTKSKPGPAEVWPEGRTLGKLDVWVTTGGGICGSGRQRFIIGHLKRDGVRRKREQYREKRVVCISLVGYNRVCPAKGFRLSHTVHLNGNNTMFFPRWVPRKCEIGENMKNALQLGCPILGHKTIRLPLPLLGALSPANGTLRKAESVLLCILVNIPEGGVVS